MKISTPNKKNLQKIAITALFATMSVGLYESYQYFSTAITNTPTALRKQQVVNLLANSSKSIVSTKEITKETSKQIVNANGSLEVSKTQSVATNRNNSNSESLEVSTVNGDPLAKERAEFEALVNNHKFSNRPAYNKKDWKALGLARQDRPDWAFEQDFLRTMNPATGKIPIAAKEIANKYAKQYWASLRTEAAIPITWTERGPNNIGGRTRAMMFAPNDASNKKVWAGGVGGGLWFTNDITTDAGWTKVNDLWDNITVSCIAHAPNNRQVFYVGTGEAYGGTAPLGSGIWRTTDGGTTWARMAGTEPVADGNFNYVSEIVVNAAGVVFATTGLIDNSVTGGGVMRFDGTTWTRIFAPAAGVGIAADGSQANSACDIEIAANGDMYVSTGIRSAGKIYKSTNEGVTWVELPNAIAGATSPARIELALAPSNPNIIYALGQNNNNAGNQDVSFFRKSIDAGTTWTNLTIPVTRGQPASGCGLTTEHFTRAQAFWGLTLKVHPTNPNLLITAGIDASRSLDGGATWTDISLWINKNPANNCGKGYIHADIHDAVFRPGNSNEVVFASDGGLDYSPNAGDAAIATPTMGTRVKNYNVTQYYSGDIAATAGSSLIIGGTQDNGTLLTNNAGIQPAVSPSGGDGGYTFISKTNSNIRISSYTNCNYYRTNSGQSTGFEEITSASMLKGNGSFINPTEYDSDADILYANIRGGGNTSTTDIFRISALSSATPTIAAVAITGDTPGDNDVTHLKKSPYTAHTLFLGLRNGNLLKVTNANTTPVGVSIMAPVVGSVSCIEVGATENQLLVTYTNYGLTSQVWETADGGATWRNKKGNLPDMPIRWALYNPQNRNQIILATDVGCWSTDNFGNGTASVPVWGSSNTSLANTRCDMMKYRPSDGLVLVATHGRGMYTTDVFVTTPIANFEMSQKVSCTGSLTVNFIDNSVGANNIWAWDVDNNGSTDYTTRNPTHTYAAVGIYSVKLTINNGATTVTRTKEIIVTNVAPTASTGCTVTANSNNGTTNGIGISRFSLGTINNTTDSNDGSYNNYACSQATALDLNTMYNVTITTGTFNAEGAKLYIDYNDNGTFEEETEKVAEFPINKVGTRTLAFTTPATGITLSKGLRARIVSNFGVLPADACDVGGSDGFGQAEDYTIFFQGAAATPTPTITLSSADLTAFTSCGASVSTEQSYTVSGANLTANIVITAPTGFNVSLTTGAGFATSVNVTAAAANAGAITIFVRQTATAANGANGNITHTSTGATQKDRAIPTSTVASPSAPTVSITPITAIAGSQTFTALASNIGGGTVNYDFKLDGVSQQNSTASTWNATSLAVGNVITCVITVTGGTCLTTNTATTNAITVTESMLTSINDAILSGKLSIYPNPTYNKVTVEFALEKLSKVAIKLTDASGKVILTETVEPNSLNFKHNIHIADYASGAYMLMITIDGKTAIKRVVKQ